MLSVNCIRRPGEATELVEGVGTVIVEDEFGNPIVVIIRTADLATTVVTADDPDFNRILHGLGIDKIVTDKPINVKHRSPGEGAELLRSPLLS